MEKQTNQIQIKQAKESQLTIVKRITRDTISEIYPLYYPQGVVDFFLQHHKDENILKDLQEGLVFLLYDDQNREVATVTIKENEINRLFVLPAYQRHGYGRILMDYAETKILQQYSCCRLDASLPAKVIYLKRGFKEIEAHVLQTESGAYLCYDVLSKEAS